MKHRAICTALTFLLTVAAVEAGWTTLTYDDFEEGWGNFINGGPKAKLVKDTALAHQGDGSAVGWDDNGQSSSILHANGIDVHTPGYQQLRVSFWYRTVEFGDGRDWFLEYYDGTDWLVLWHYVCKTDFFDREFRKVVFALREGDYTFPTDMRFRLRADANSPSQAVHWDEIKVEACRDAGRKSAPPRAKAQYVQARDGESSLFKLDAMDPDGDPLKYAVTVPPEDGAVTVDAKGTATYKPNAGFSGEETFGYVVSDGQDGASARVSIAVWPKLRLRLPKIFTDHMVLQRQEPIVIRGWAAPGEGVKVTFNSRAASAKANAAGEWLVTLPAMEADNMPHALTVQGATDTITLNNVMIGEVWIASGQSNMCRATTPANDYPNVRVFHARDWGPHSTGNFNVPRKDDQNSVVGWWPATVANMQKGGPMDGRFTEVGFEFARELHENLDVPVAVMQSAFGGTSVRQWQPVEDPDSIYQWGIQNPTHQGHLYYATLHGSQPFSLRGFVWWQGENDGNRGADYYAPKKDMIERWRANWNAPDAPFYFVQIMPTTYQKMAELWVSQHWISQHVPNTGLIPNNDIWPADTRGTHPAYGFPTTGSGNPHPPNKHVPATRMAHAALRHTYGVSGGEVYGPSYKSHKVVGNKIRVTFQNVGKGLTTNDGTPPNWFLVGPEHPAERPPTRVDHYYHALRESWVPAAAAIVGPDTVEVTVPKGITTPGHLTFGYHQSALLNLFNSEGLPAICFRLILGREPGLPNEP